MIICKEIRKVEGGYIVEARYPFCGPGTSGGCGEVACADWADVVALLAKCADEERGPDTRAASGDLS